MHVVSFGSRSLLDGWKHSANAELLIGLQGVKFGLFSSKAQPLPPAAHLVCFGTE